MKYTISAVILAGGKARRMNGADKGLQLLQNKPLISHVIERLQPQVIDISINANRHHTEYAQWGFPVFSDELPDFQGPLSGMLTALEKAKTDFVLFVPCDSPYFPQNLLEKLKSAVILAGGKARRMNGADKGLQLLQNKPLISHVIERLQPQVVDISINANRHHTEYAHWGFPVFSDELPDFQGPLSGMLTALEKAKTDFILFVPCDSPYFPQNLLEKLKSAVKNDRTLMAYAKDKEREHPTFCLMSVQLKEKLRAYLNEGERRLLQFMNKNGAVAVQFDEREGRFVNFNTLEDLQ